MLYLLDANVLITANNQYYPIDRVPEFWEWLVHMGQAGHIKIVREVYEEFSGGDDELAQWAQQDEVQNALLLDEAVDVHHVRNITSNGYANNLTDDELEELGRDPFLIAYGLTDLGNRTIVTTEVSKPSRQRANRHIPDVCAQFNVPCINTFEMMTALNFSTGWKGQL